MNDIYIQVSEDGSHTIYNKTIDETYHSVHGAYTESMHIFIKNGLLFKKQPFFKILEIGFGTGLNAFLALIEGAKQNIDIVYETIELYPLPEQIYKNLNYSVISSQLYHDVFMLLHKSPWDKQIQINKSFELKKIHADALKVELGTNYNLVFYDAFSPEKQPELWSTEIFGKIFNSMAREGILTTYCAKGTVKQNLRNSGFTIERLPGPPGKRHMIRATKS